MSTTSLPFPRADLVASASIVLVFLTLVLLVGPIHEFPEADDWDYARTAQTFAATGQLQRSEYSQATVILHALVGGAVIKFFGFSFTALRLTTLGFTLVTLLAGYALLRTVGFDPARSALGMLTLLVIPEFIYLAFSFMTDIPALCWLMLALLFYVRALQASDARQAALASLFVTCAFFVRQTALLLLLAFDLTVLATLPRSSWRKFLVAGSALPLVTISLYVLAPGQNGLTNWGTASVTFGLTFEQLTHPEGWGIYVVRTVQSLLWLGLYLAPLLLASLFALSARRGALRNMSRARKLGLGLVALATGLVVVRLGSRGEWFPYFMRMGMRPYLSYIAGDQGALRAEILPQWVFIALTLGAALAGVGIATILLLRIGRPLSPSTLLMIASMVLFAIAVLFFGIWYERYLLPLAFGAIILILDFTRGARVAWGPALLGLLAIGFFSWALMQDHWGLNEARWRVGRELLARNIPVQEIDGGYEWDAWYLYPAADAYIRETGAPYQIEPWRYVIDPKYLLAFRPLKGYAVQQVVPFASPFSAHQFYVLQRGP